MLNVIGDALKSNVIPNFVFISHNELVTLNDVGLFHDSQADCLKASENMKHSEDME